jgi:3-hydroxyisobutyrate dehydrogenase-like beta-hydroxyacid dehydrogenase
MASVGVIGLGAMGGAIAARLTQNGVDVQGYDISTAAIDRFVSAGGRASSNLDAVAAAQIVITSLPNDEILWSVLRSGLIDKLRPDQTFVEMSTILPETMTAVGNMLKDKVREIVDSPVSGGPNEATAGKLSLLIGVDGQLQRQTHDVLSRLGTVHLLGKVGNGKTLKLVNNMMSLGTTAIAMEAFQLGAELGLDYETMYSVLSKSGGSSAVFNKRGPYLLQNDFTARFAVYLAEKDTGLALQMAHQQQYPTPLLANVHQRYESAMAEGFAQEDIVALIKLYKRSS